MTDLRRRGEVQPALVQRATTDLLIGLGYDPDDQALVDTPARVARAWVELLDADPPRITAFDVAPVDEMVVLRNVTGWSVCEHHLLPFSYTATVAYMPRVEQGRSRILGLSKLARLVRQQGHALQLQERMASQVADAIMRETLADGVGVRIRGVHLCAVMRGVRASEAEFVTTSLLGSMRTEAAQRAEFLSLV